MKSPLPPPWPLDPGETLLWGGRARPLRPRDGAALLVAAVLILWLLWRASALSLTPSIALLLFAALYMIQAIVSAFRRLHASRLRFAVTDRRVLVAAPGGRIGSVPREHISALLPVGGDAMACYPSLSPSAPLPAPLVILGPLRPGDAPALHAALCRLLGLPPPPDAPPAHAFPPWMGPAERRRLAADFPLPGDPILWVGRPAWHVIPWHLAVSAIGTALVALVLCALALHGHFPLFSLRDLALGLFVIAYLGLLAAFPVLFAAWRRRTRYILTAHGACVLSSRAMGKPSIRPRAALPVPRTVPHGKRRADLLFDTRPPFGFPSLPTDVLPDALSALASPPAPMPTPTPPPASSPPPQPSPGTRTSRP